MNKCLLESVSSVVGVELLDHVLSPFSVMNSWGAPLSFPQWLSPEMCKSPTFLWILSPQRVIFFPSLSSCLSAILVAVSDPEFFCFLFFYVSLPDSMTQNFC